MSRGWLVLGLASLVAAGELPAQAVPDNSQAARVNPDMRRWPSLGEDPFRHVFWPKWGLVIDAGALGANNTVDASDVGSLIFLSDRDSLLIGDIVNAFGLVPRGEGVRGVATAEAGASLGGPLGGHLAIALSGVARGYGTFLVDDDAVRMFRDGNLLNQEFAIGQTHGTGLLTADAGAHLLVKTGPIGSIDGPRATLGVGGRYLRPVFYAHGEMASDSRVAITDSSIAATVQVDTWRHDDLGAHFGSGKAAEFLLRITWPTQGFALEAMVTNVGGSVTIDSLIHEQVRFNVNTTSLKEVSDSLDAASYDSLGMENGRKVDLPRFVRFAASAWGNRILQLDVAMTLPVTGEFEAPLMVEVGSTWRLVNVLPLRAGFVLGGTQGVGYTGGFGLEAKNLLFRVTGSSLGGFFKSAKGAAGRLEFGFFF